MNEISFKKFYPINLIKKKEEIKFFWDSAPKKVKDEKIFNLIKQVLEKKSLKTENISILIFNIKRVDSYLYNKEIKLHKFIDSIKFDSSEKKEKRKECIMDIYQAIVSYFNNQEVENTLNNLVDGNILFEEKTNEQEREIIQIYKRYRKSQKYYSLFLYDEIVKAIEDNQLEETLKKLGISQERGVFSDIMNRILFDIVSFIKFNKEHIKIIIVDFFDKVKDEVRIESFKRILSFYAKKYNETDDIEICSPIIMRKIHDYLKDPHKNSPKWQWGNFNEEQIKIMRLWLINSDLEKYFSIEVKDKIRLKFWKKYIKYLEAVRYFEKLNQAIIMQTAKHIFIEFGKKGNAAYIYEKDYIGFDEISRLSTTDKLKNTERAIVRITHSGNWESVLKAKLRNLNYIVKIWR